MSTRRLSTTLLILTVITISVALIFECQPHPVEGLNAASSEQADSMANVQDSRIQVDDKLNTGSERCSRRSINLKGNYNEQKGEIRLDVTTLYSFVSPPHLSTFTTGDGIQAATLTLTLVALTLVREVLLRFHHGEYRIDRQDREIRPDQATQFRDIPISEVISSLVLSTVGDRARLTTRTLKTTSIYTSPSPIVEPTPNGAEYIDYLQDTEIGLNQAIQFGVTPISKVISSINLVLSIVGEKTLSVTASPTVVALAVSPTPTPTPTPTPAPTPTVELTLIREVLLRFPNGAEYIDLQDREIRLNQAIQSGIIPVSKVISSNLVLSTVGDRAQTARLGYSSALFTSVFNTPVVQFITLVLGWALSLQILGLKELRERLKRIQCWNAQSKLFVIGLTELQQGRIARALFCIHLSASSMICALCSASVESKLQGVYV